MEILINIGLFLLAVIVFIVCAAIFTVGIIILFGKHEDPAAYIGRRPYHSEKHYKITPKGIRRRLIILLFLLPLASCTTDTRSELRWSNRDFDSFTYRYKVYYQNGDSSSWASNQELQLYREGCGCVVAELKTVICGVRYIKRLN